MITMFTMRTRWTHRLFRTLLAFAALSLLSPLTHGQDKPLIFPLLASPPYAWLDATGKPQGLYPDMVEAMAKASGVPIHIEVVPFARAATMVATGAADGTLIFENSITSGKTQDLAVAFYTNQVVLLRPGLTVRSRPELGQLNLARLNGGCQELANDSTVKAKFQDVANQEAGLRLLMANRVDGSCRTTAALVDAIALTGSFFQFQSAQRFSLGSKPVLLLMAAKTTQDMGIKMSSALQQIQKSGELTRIFKQRLGDGYIPLLPK